VKLTNKLKLIEEDLEKTKKMKAKVISPNDNSRSTANRDSQDSPKSPGRIMKQNKLAKQVAIA